MVELNENGMISPGLHKSSLKEVFKILVQAFPTSSTRLVIYNAFLKFLKQLSDLYRIHEVWIDGSFSTAKVNPNDMDIVVYFHVESFMKIQKEWNDIRCSNKTYLDIYPAVAITDDLKSKVSVEIYNTQVNQRNYWRGQFGYDRNDIPKGIVIIQEKEIHELVVGGDS